MLVIISDIHLTDGESGTTISNRAFKIFRERLREMAYEASWRKNGNYKPIEKIDLILLGDILDIIRSVKWLEDDVRPWDSPESDAFKSMVRSINAGILRHNEDALNILKGLNSKDNSQRITLPPSDGNGDVATVGYEPESQGRIPVDVKIHYMVGNHDWFYHVQGETYNEIRKSVVDAMGLSNDFDKPFAHDPKESTAIWETMASHAVFARHGDIYDSFNYEGNRNASSLGDAIVVELLNRFPNEVKKQIGNQLSAEFLNGLKEIDNVRPLLLIPVWIDTLLDRFHSSTPNLVKKVKGIWNKLADDFLNLDFVKNRDDWWDPLDNVDKLQLALKFTNNFSFDAIARIIRWYNEKSKGKGESYYKKAMEENAYKENRAFIVYGHTHHPEIVPLNSNNNNEQIHMNSGTWRAVYEMAKNDKDSSKFIGYKVMTYLAFFKDDERKGRKFESWTGSLG